MSWTKGLIKEAIGELPDNINTLADILDDKVELRNYWLSPLGKKMAKKLQDDAKSSLKPLMNFELLTHEQIVGYLARYRWTIEVLSSIRGTDNIDEIQAMLDEQVKLEADLRRE